ncbi:hypothetical protein HC931_12675 [Candidatus Gracilibacteria bacterium]|jgi:Bacterial PH domain|nr:hypothetical protein [Candidatus Gracilibacteria bacterium]NJM86803.1 hypothetical protein [Hydrococcus sp. RU_2_2]
MLRTFPVVPTSDQTLWAIAGIILLTMLAAIVIFLTTENHTKLIALIPLFVGGLFSHTAYASRHSQVELSEDKLSIKGEYGRQIPIASLICNRAEQISLSHSSLYKPKLRTNGTSLPGYLCGWFKLQNNEKALICVTDSDRVVYLPTRDNYSLLISLANPEEFLQFLREICS